MAPVSYTHLDVYKRQQGMLSVMYRANASEQPVPSAEVQGLLLLTATDIQSVVQQPITLAHYLAHGGQAILRTPLPTNHILVPFLQLRAFAAILQAQPDFSIK